jgi:hypothetical protein
MERMLDKNKEISQTDKIEGCRQGDTVSLWAVNDSGFETISAQARIK